MGSKFTELIIDAADPDALATFWTAVLGWPRERVLGDAVEIADPAGSLPTLVFVPVDDAKVVKNRVHIDVNPTGQDQAAELARLMALGATTGDVGQGEDVPWVVVADPEGNEFCLLKTRLD